MKPARAAAGLAGLVLAGVLTGCGSTSAPGDRVPSLEAGVADVRQALGRGDLDGARARLQTLVEQARTAQVEGDITTAEADRITTAAGALLARLPGAVAPTPTVTPTPTPTPSATPSPRGDDKGKGEKGPKGDKKDRDDRDDEDD